MPQTAQLPYDPAHTCRGCGAEGASVTYHAERVLAVFGEGPGFPCTAPDAAAGEHLCCRCEGCGNSWTESAAQPNDGTRM